MPLAQRLEILEPMVFASYDVVALVRALAADVSAGTLTPLARETVSPKHAQPSGLPVSG